MNPTKKQPKWKRLLPSVLWALAGVSLFILLVSAMDQNGRLRCTGLEISIKGYQHEMFISEVDVKALIENDIAHTIKGCATDAMNLRHIENILQKDNWISKAQLFVDNKQVLHVNISERLPVARIFTQNNRSYYIDSQATILPLSMQQIADVPVFTNLPDRPQKLAGADSSFWQQLGQMGKYIINDRFLLMQIGQINVTPNRELELQPVVGNHIVLLGSPDKFAQKLERLKKFDLQILAKAGINKYSRLDLRYDKQIVATLRGTETVMPQRDNLSLNEDLAVSSPSPSIADDVSLKPVAALAKEQPKKALEKEVAMKNLPLKKATPEKAVAKKNDSKPAKKININTASIAKKRTVETDKNKLAGTNNKTNKNTLKQLAKNVNKVGITEVDIRKERSQKMKDKARAVMPKKQ